MAVISADINYSREILEAVFKCKICAYPLLMFGCDNPNCRNYWRKNLYHGNKPTDKQSVKKIKEVNPCKQ